MATPRRDDPATWTPRTRREVLAAGLAGVAGAALAACSDKTVHHARSVKPAGSDIGAIEHVVVLMHENRSFDHYFGTYPGVRGFDDRPKRGLGTFAQAWPGAPAGTDRLLPFHLDTSTGQASCTFDLSHAWTAQHQSWNDGAMDRFVATHAAAGVDGPEHGTLTMGHYTRADLPFHFALADAFTLCDGYHCSVMGPTHPNRLHALSGTIDPTGAAGGPSITTSIAPTTKFSVSWETMPERLSAKGITWKTYNPAEPQYRVDNPAVMAFSDNILLYFRQYSDPTTELHRRAFLPIFPDDFAHDVATDQLPQVSWIVPPIGFDEHPPAPPALGAWFTHEVLSALVSNPKVWAKTALFVMYDENDGFFDHVAPPTPPPGTAGEFLDVDPLPDVAGGIAGPIGLGFRVPMIVVSPFSRGGYICSDTFDHTSQLRLLETIFGVEAPNISAWRRKVTGDLTTTMGAPTATDVPKLPATPKDDPSIANCDPKQISVEANIETPPYPVPTDQRMPRQERGTARRVRG
jgi:phospholipase C